MNDKIINELNREAAQVKTAFMASWQGVALIVAASAITGFVLGYFA